MPSRIVSRLNVPRRRGVHGIGPRTVSRGLRASHRDDRRVAPMRREIRSGPGPRDTPRRRTRRVDAVRSARRPSSDSCSPHPPRRARTIRRGLHRDHPGVPRTAAPAVRAGGDGEGDADDPQLSSRTGFRTSKSSRRWDATRGVGADEREVVIRGRGGSLRAADVRGSDYARRPRWFGGSGRGRNHPVEGLRHLDRGYE